MPSKICWLRMRAPEFWQGRDYTARLAAAVLSPFGFLYGATVAWKRDRTQPYRPRAKVICVGNLTVGGTGKTPIAIAIAQLLLRRGLKPMFLTRGYGGKERGPIFVNLAHDSAEQVGDEPLLLARAAPAIVARDRAAGAHLADEAQADAIIMDDGHQNFSVAKDLSLVLVDAGTGFGNGHIVPAGPLRESISQGLARADAIVLTGDGDPELRKFKGPVLRAHFKPSPETGLRGQPVVAFAGTGRPEKFFATLAELGAEFVETSAFDDHHEYTASELARLKSKARGADALLITTEKDFARLSPAERTDVATLPIAATFDDAAAIESLLDRLLPAKARP
jgi:tetraacyldisaccharide 4'-kinase